MNSVLKVCFGVQAAENADRVAVSIAETMNTMNALSREFGKVSKGYHPEPNNLVDAIRTLKAYIESFPSHKLGENPIHFYHDKTCLIMHVVVGKFSEIIRFEMGSNNTLVIRNNTNLIPSGFEPIGAKDYCAGHGMTVQSLCRGLTGNHQMISTRIDLKNFKSDYVKVWVGKTGDIFFQVSNGEDTAFFNLMRGQWLEVISTIAGDEVVQDGKIVTFSRQR